MIVGTIKTAADHAMARLRERTDLDPVVLRELRRKLSKTRGVPPGVHHVSLGNTWAVVKSRSGRPFVATVLSRDMRRLPGRNLTGLLPMDKTAVWTAFFERLGVVDTSGAHALESSSWQRSIS